ncbi:MAG: rRNA ((2503)-C2)-methyltransferase [Frankiales bacterium]|nr:rRNA ((2503)-C2)-methyltransferase [Frankiales bacterium]
MTVLPLVFDAPKRGLPPQHLADLDSAGRRDAVVALGEKAFRADQLSRHYFAGRGLDEATDLSPSAREHLAPLLPTLLTRVRDQQADGGDTTKTLWRAHDGSLIESVLMRYPDRTTVCVSSQAGCGMACPFCATGQAGLTRNLSTAEIVEQVVRSNAAELAAGRRGVTNLVYMGMGEPLANANRVLASVRRFTDPAPEGLGLSQRSLVVSTVGVVPAIRRLQETGLKVTLALSLHAPDDELRNTLVPVNTRWPVKEVLEAAFGYTRSTGRRLSIEYAMIKDVNDQAWRADLLAKRLKGKLVHVNLIPLNPTPGSAWDASDKAVEREFVRRLKAAGISTTVRDTKGQDIAGACGQLAAE